MESQPTEGAGAPAVTVRTTDADLSLAFGIWHRLLRLLLLVQLPLLAMFAFFREIDGTQFPLLAVPVVMVVISSHGSDRFRAAVIAVGMAWCSWLLVVWSGGATEAHFHVLIVIGLIALYRDVLALAIVGASALAMHAAVGLIDPTLIYAGFGASSSAFGRVLVNLIAILAALAVPVFFWRGTRAAESQSARRASSQVRAQAREDQQAVLARVYATVARRSQNLLGRQIDVIERLEQEEKDPATLEQLFMLDHLATRMNREAASMLVLAGEEPNRRVVGSPPLTEVGRGAIGEIEDYRRVDMQLADDRPVEGRAVASLVHLLSELLENAASYSPPDSRVLLTGRSLPDGDYEMTVIDRGLGMDDASLAEYNELLANPPLDTTPSDSQRLGLDVVARLAGRAGMQVRLTRNSGSGLAAQLIIPAALLGDGASTSVAPGTAANRHVGAATTTPPSGLPPVAAVAEMPSTAPPVPIPQRALAAPAAPAAPSPAPSGATTGFGPFGSPPSQASAPQDSPQPAAPAPKPVPATLAQSGGWSYAGHLTDGAADDATVKPAKKRKLRLGRRSRSAADESAAANQVAPDAAATGNVEATVPAVPRDRAAAPDAAGLSSAGQASRDLLDVASFSAAPPPADQAGARAPTPDANPGPSPAATPAFEPAAPPPPAAAVAPAPALPAAGSPPPAPAGPVTPPTQASPTRPVFDPDPAPAGSPPPARPAPPVQERSDRPTPPAQVPDRPSPTPADSTSGALRAAGDLLDLGDGVPPAGRAPAAATPSAPTNAGPPPSPAAPQPAAPQPAAPAASPAPTAFLEEASQVVRQAQEVARQASAAPQGPRPPTLGGSEASLSSTPSRPGGLPKRRRGAALPSGLKDATDAPPPRSSVAEPVSREQSSALLSSYQTRLQAGRKAAQEQMGTRNPSPPEDDR